jgi:hypothetical protein
MCRESGECDDTHPIHTASHIAITRFQTPCCITLLLWCIVLPNALCLLIRVRGARKLNLDVSFEFFCLYRLNPPKRSDRYLPQLLLWLKEHEWDGERILIIELWIWWHKNLDLINIEANTTRWTNLSVINDLTQQSCQVWFIICVESMRE